jgi:hypothetical protein
VLHFVRGLGYVEDVADDPTVPLSRDEIETYWAPPQPEITRSLDQVVLSNNPSRGGPERAI